jgi:RNA polymerase sigma factor (TIGR02999 family)
LCPGEPFLTLDRVGTDSDFTALVERARQGDRAAVDELFAATYADLQALARARLRMAPRLTVLDTVGLVNESYMRLVQARQLRPQDRAHFVRYAARAMRSVVVDYVRKRRAERRGGDQVRVDLSTDVADQQHEGELEILKVHEALAELEATDPRAVEVVEMRYFAGMTEPEIAQALEVGERTVRRDWARAKVLLAEALGE